MSRIGTLKTAAITLSVAFGVGFIMQYGQENTVTTRVEPDNADLKAIRPMLMSKNARGESVFGVPDVVTTPLEHAKNVQAVVAVDVVYTEFSVPEMGTILATPIAGCAATLTAAPEDAAMVSLYLVSPCHADEDFVLRQGGMEFTSRTDDDGIASLMVPALSVESTFSVLFQNIEQAQATVNVPDVRLFDRAILEWQGSYNLQLHALEAGASIGDPGHVWSASVHTASEAVAGEQGFVVRLGTTDAEFPRLAEVYTYPAGQPRTESSTALQLSAAITQTNCGREVDTKTIQTTMGGPLVTRKIGVPLPSCESIGRVVVLRDVFDEITLALR